MHRNLRIEFSISNIDDDWTLDMKHNYGASRRKYKTMDDLKINLKRAIDLIEVEANKSVKIPVFENV